MMTPRKRVLATLDMARPDRAPRQLWLLPIAADRYPEEIKRMREDFPDDFGCPAYHCPPSRIARGSLTSVGTCVDEWGCVFTNIQEGVVGEVKDPVIKTWSDLDKVHVPEELLAGGIEDVNSSCAESDKFMMACCCPRPWERMQFLRGSQNLYYDIMDLPPEFFALRNMVHDYYMRDLERWAKTDVDGLMFMDDWGSQLSLLIPPARWREIFKPLYSDYCRVARDAGKKMFMHSDGHIFEIYEDLIEIGVDAVNSQLFTMDIEEIGRRFAGRITFWGEIDRQHLLVDASVEQVREAVRRVHRALWRDGGAIAQCEFGPGGKPQNVRAVYEEWDRLTS
ncbi:MAG TPA: uroporphyrinogen decarboxylase family protein [Candidatus Brocadiia bacterium]|nr:uroporphyrinogen decarboxylase family protein [Candidatus Brocadiia bacterium]